MKLKNCISAQMNVKKNNMLSLTIDVPAKADIQIASLNCCIVG